MEDPLDSLPSKRNDRKDVPYEANSSDNDMNNTLNVKLKPKTFLAKNNSRVKITKTPRPGLCKISLYTYKLLNMFVKSDSPSKITQKGSIVS